MHALADGPTHELDYAKLVEHLLNHVELIAAGQTYRFTDLELYLWNDSHPDPYSHRQPITKEWGRWYVHRTGSGYRSGSFKGVDMTFGDGESYVGVLVRGVVDDENRVLDGPSLIADHWLARLGADSPADLDRLLGERRIWDIDSPLHVRWNETSQHEAIDRVPRVGLSLKRLDAFPEMPRYLAKPYRFLTDPRRTRKGRPGIVIGLHQQRLPVRRIAERTGLTPRVIEVYLRWYEDGRGRKVDEFAGRDLNVAERCRLLGALRS